MDDEALMELKELRLVLAENPALFKKFYRKEAKQALRRTVLLSHIGEQYLDLLAEHAERTEYERGDLIIREGQSADYDAIVIARGEIRRWAGIDGRRHAVDTFDKNSIGMLHLYNRNPARFNAECVTPVVAYRIRREFVDKLLRDNPDLAVQVIQSLTEYVRNNCFVISTPLFEQQATQTTITATSIGATIDAFYRSAMNNLINERLTGVRGAFFPQMHIQIPTRVIYINGLKQVRNIVQEETKSVDSRLLRALASFAPGVMMTPFSSLLEASNAHQNSEPMLRRCTRGMVPRISREIIFGLGINQLSDYCTERVSWIGNVHVRNAAGSISAGILAGFVSHIPHNLSSLKLQDPNTSYQVHWQKLYSRYLSYVPPTVKDESMRRLTAQALCVFFPIGVIRRSLQIGGTFIIVNGTIYTFRDRNWI